MNAEEKNRGEREVIISKFENLREENLAIASKLDEIELEEREHTIVIQTLNDVEQNRKCFRMIGGILVERTVSEVLPALKHNVEQFGKLKETLRKQLEEKGKELVQFKEKHNIRFVGETDKDEKKEKNDDVKPGSSSGVLVSDK